MRSAVIVLTATAVACTADHATTHARSVSLGPSTVATLDETGALRIIQGGQVVLATATGTPLLTRAIDADDPTGFHDPKKLGAVTLTPLGDAAIELDSPAPGILHLSTKDDGMATVLVSLALGADDGAYTGLGERYDHTDPHGQIVGMDLEIDGTRESGTTDRHVPVPWIVSSKGYGAFVRSREAGAWDVGATDPSVVRATFEGTAIDVTLVIDADPLEVVATLTKQTGLPRKTPTWALSPMMWRHVDSQSELLGDLAHIRSLHIPTSAFWIDDGWQPALNTLDFDPKKLPDPPALADTMGTLGFELLGWNSPYLETPGSGPPDEAQALYPQAKARSYFVESRSGVPFTAPGPDAKQGFGMIDFTNPDASAFWTSLAGGAVAVGMNGFKLDYGEDMIPDILGGRLDLKRWDGETERTARTYPLGYQGAYRNALAKTGDGGLLVVRASTYGGASVADIVWPGDLDNGFEHDGDMDPDGLSFVGGLPASIVAGVTLAASGFPLYGADTAGYRQGMPTKEALLRWAEHTALSMVMQLGPGEDKYPWYFDAETVTLYTALASLHQKLVPYLASLLVDAEANGTPTLRALPLAFPSDADGRPFADDEYMLGPALLVAPVVSAGATSRDVHVPPGTWFSWWDGSRVSGPTTMTVAAPLGQPPLFVRAGSLLAMLPDGIDTLLGASDPSTVGLDAKAGLAEGSAWVQGNADASFLDGSVVSVEDTASGVEVRWVPQGSGRVLTVSVDLRGRTGKTTPLTQVMGVSGSTPSPVSSASDARAASGSAYYLAGDSAVLRLDGASDVRIE